MFSYPPAEDVLPGLGDKVVSAIVAAAEATRADLAEYRLTCPAWVADHSDRGLSNWIHDRMWAHLRRGLDDVDAVRLVDKPPIREIAVGYRYRARVKRHSVDDRVRSYPTKSACAFWTQSATLDGLEEVRLGFGYRWDPELHEVGNAVISLRDGHDKEAVWVVEIDAAGGDAGTEITWKPVDPTLPQIDLYGAVAAEGDEEAT